MLWDLNFCLCGQVRATGPLVSWPADLWSDFRQMVALFYTPIL